MLFQKELIKTLRSGGEKTAIEQKGKSISYSELLNSSNKITQFLLDKKLNKETPVGIFLQDKVDLICAIIGVANARCTFIPIDPKLPAKRLNAIQDQLGLAHLISAENLNANLTLESYNLEEILTSKTLDPAKMNYPTFEDDDSLYVYFTSGSTGEPKGIIGKNCSLLQFIQWEVKAFELDTTTRVSQFISPFFDAFLRDVFVPLMVHGTICIPPADDDFFTPEKMTQWIDDEKVTLIHCVPSVFRIFNNEHITSGNFENLKNVLLSGEKIVPATLTGWYNTFNDRIQLINLYGTTETTMIRSCYKIQPADVSKNRMPIGQPIDDTELLVLNKDLKPCGLLMTGDLYIMSDYISKGYLNNPELTKEKFVKISSASGEETAAFKTGDKARKMAGGVLELLGREDRQVKIRGIRIELDEIENVLMRSEYVSNAVAINHVEETDAPGAQSNESLVVFVVKNEKTADSVELITELEKLLKEQLPGYMLPSAINAVSEFSLLSNGKVDYKGLLKSLENKTAAIVLPANATEEKLSLIWKEILGDKPISVQDNFNKIGGNSLAMMRLISKIYKEFNVRIPLHQIFSNLTIFDQAKLIGSFKKDDIFLISKAPSKAAYSLSSAQERMYFNYEHNKESTAYNLPMAWEIADDFDHAQAETALKQLIVLHDSLRTEFRFNDTDYEQVVKDEVVFKLEEISAKDQDEQASVLAFVKPFDLAKAPLFRCGVITTASKKRILVMDIHHVICDGMSQINLYADFLKLYKGETIPPLKIQYRDYAEWECNFKSTDKYMSLREFWLKSFEGEISKLNLPTTDNTADFAEHEGQSFNFKIDKAVYAPIAQLLKEENITDFSGLFSIFYLFLVQLTGQEDIVIGINTAGRIQSEVDNVVGMFAKTLPVRHKLEINQSFRALMKSMHKQLTEVNDKQIYDLADIISELNKNRSAPVKSLFDVMFVFQNFEDKNIKKEGSSFELYNFENNTSKYPMTLFASESDDVLLFKFEYALGYFAKKDMEFLSSEFEAMMKKIAGNLDSELIEYFSDDASKSAMGEGEILFNF